MIIIITVYIQCDHEYLSSSHVTPIYGLMGMTLTDIIAFRGFSPARLLQGKWFSVWYIKPQDK